MLVKYLFCLGAFASLAAFGSGLPDESMAKKEYIKFIEKSDPGCIELSSFKINKKEGASLMGTDYYVLEYEAVVKSISTCTKKKKILGISSAGFGGAQIKPIEDLLTKTIQKPLAVGEEIKDKGRITFAKTVEGWKPTDK